LSLPMDLYNWSWCSGRLLYKTRCSCLCILDFKPRFGYKNFSFCPTFIFAPSSLRHHFFASTLSLSFFHDIKRTNERANERTNGNSSLLTSCSSFAYHY
jgi:hypothetical protein